jgi:hypothetical protein
VTAGRGYGSPDAFRRALTDRLRAAARESRWDLPQLQQQMAYDRLLERLYFVDDGWIVKGAAALLAREIGVRASIDIDVYRAKALEIAEPELRAAAARDIGDWFRFELGPRQPAGDGSPAVRLPVLAYIGQTEWASFHVDLVGSDIVMTGTPDNVPPLARVAIPDVEQHGYRAYPLVDHIADKIASMFQRYGRGQQPSTRFRDLVDLVSITGGATVDAEAQVTSLRLGRTTAQAHASRALRCTRPRSLGSRLRTGGGTIPPSVREDARRGTRGRTTIHRPPPRRGRERQLGSRAPPLDDLNWWR